jgi:uncharacterized membrane protein
VERDHYATVRIVKELKSMQETRRAPFPVVAVFGLVVGIALVLIAEFVLDGLADGNQTWHWIQHGVFFLGGLVTGVAGTNVYLSEQR